MVSNGRKEVKLIYNGCMYLLGKTIEIFLGRTSRLLKKQKRSPELWLEILDIFKTNKLITRILGNKKTCKPCLGATNDCYTFLHST